MVSISRRQAALVAGLSIVTMAVLAGFAYGYVVQRLFVPNKPAVTAGNIASSMILFRLGIFSFLIVLLCDVLAAWALHVFLRPTDADLSLLAAWFRLVYSAILGTALLNFAFVLLLLNDTNYLPAFGTMPLNTLVMFFSNGFFAIWSFGLVIFGCHLHVLGYVVLKSHHTPRIFGVLLIVAAWCYMLSNCANLLWPDYEKYKASVELFTSVPMVVGELGFGLWLLVKGGMHPADEPHNVEKKD